MSTNRLKITIIGTGRVGTSIGLALRQDGRFEIVGHDRELKTAQFAQQRGALDRVEWHLLKAVEDADIVVLALPLGAIQPTLKQVAPALRPGTLVTDTASLKLPVMAWAQEFLPDQVHFVGGNPVVNPALALDARSGPEAAHADLFAGGLYGLMPGVNCAPEALQLASDLVALLRATPFYPDPAEHDGLMAAIEGLPGLLSLALMRTAVSSPVWREARKMADFPFNTTTHLVERDPARQRDLLLHNRDNLIRWLDTLLGELSDLRQFILAGDAEALDQAVQEAEVERRLWVSDRHLGTWEPKQAIDLPTTSDHMAQLVGFGWRKRKKQ
jgi:prephenate dehydrogenase